MFIGFFPGSQQIPYRIGKPRILMSKKKTHNQIHPEYGERAGSRGTGVVEPVARAQFIGHERGQGNTSFPFSADDQDWQLYLVHPHSATCTTLCSL